MSAKAIIAKAKEILSLLSVIDLPINVDELAKLRGLKVIPYPLENDVSGILVIKDLQSTIGYNQNESRVRRRFTIAHELGHYELHRNESKLFVDKSFKVMFRNTSTPSNQPDSIRYEQEANAFAAYLLMPENLVRAEISNMEFDLSSEESIKELAKKFDVSTTAMSYRIANLNKL
jgi:Zn-dependent peptidase ImmA (M78 family)